MRRAVIGAVVFVAALSAGEAAAVPPERAIPIANPDLEAACGLDIHMILDESGSVGIHAAVVREAFNAFTSALNNTGSRIAVSEFSTVADLPLSGAARNTYTTVTDQTRADIFGPYIANGYRPDGATNWEDGLRMGRYFLPRPSAEQSHLTVFITDGDPNEVIRGSVGQADYETKVPLSLNEVQEVYDSNWAKDAAVPNANAIKGQGSHVLAIAVGSGLSSQSSLDRIKAVSGNDVFSGFGTFDIARHDVYRVPNFDDLAEALREAAFGLCAPSLTVRKFVDVTPDPGTNDLVPAPDWDMTTTVSPIPADWVLPATGAGASATVTTDASGFASFQWTTATHADSEVLVTEQNPALVPPGFVNDPLATSCVVRTPDTTGDRPLPVTTTPNGFRATITDESIATCTMVNRVPPRPAIQIEKATNGSDADAAPGPSIPTGDPIVWTYHVTNAGNVTLSNLVVSDNRGVAVACPQTSLGPGGEMVCTASGVAVAGAYANVGSVSGVDPFGTAVSATDPSHYTGAVPGIDIEKATNGSDADHPPGPFLPVGGAVSWTYVARNEGAVLLTGVTVTDDRGVVVSCPSTTLAIGASMTCTGAGTALAGPYENTATVTGLAGAVTVQDSDASHYFGEAASVDIEKHVNGVDADAPTGPMVGVGAPVGWTYAVTNTGNVPLRWSVTDNLIAALTCPHPPLILPGASFGCHAAGPATAGQHTNIGTVQGLSPSGQIVSDSDPANYFGVQGGIELKKFTNLDDADTAPGPFIPVGAPITWTYRVTNTGNGPLSGIVVRDLDGVGVSCPSSTLAIGVTMTCTGTGTAQAGQYTNIATVVGFTAPGRRVFAFDPSNYYGTVGAILLEKSTNGNDADAAPGPAIRVGDPVTWTYTVYNTGNTALTGVAVTDDRRVAVTCPAATLAVGGQMACTASGIATLGQYENTGAVVGTDPGGTRVFDTDPSHYFGAVSGIEVKKYTNGEDADAPTGPVVTVGGPVVWTYLVRNIGNVPIRQVAVADDGGIVPTLVGGGDEQLDPNETWAYAATGVATAGQYINTATVTGLDVLEHFVSDDDPSHYFGPPPVLPQPQPPTVPPETPQTPPEALPPAPGGGEVKPIVSVFKRAWRSRVRAGTTVRFTLRVRNAGSVTAHRVRVCDQLPSGLAYASARGARIVGRSACFNAGTVRARQSRTFVVSARADATSRPRRICNTAVRTASGLSARRVRECVRILPDVDPRPGGVTG